MLLTVGDFSLSGKRDSLLDISSFCWVSDRFFQMAKAKSENSDCTDSPTAEIMPARATTGIRTHMLSDVVMPHTIPMLATSSAVPQQQNRNTAELKGNMPYPAVAISPASKTAKR
jgi:hypothetical protein